MRGWTRTAQRRLPSGRLDDAPHARTAHLCDEGTFVEYGSVVVAGSGATFHGHLIKNTTGDGMVAGLGQINGDLFPGQQSSTRDVIRHGSSRYPRHEESTTKRTGFEVAEQQRLPTVLFAEGGGGRPGDTDGSGVEGRIAWFLPISHGFQAWCR